MKTRIRTVEFKHPKSSPPILPPGALMAAGPEFSTFYRDTLDDDDKLLSSEIGAFRTIDGRIYLHWLPASGALDLRVYEQVMIFHDEESGPSGS